MVSEARRSPPSSTVVYPTSYTKSFINRYSTPHLTGLEEGKFRLAARRKLFLQAPEACVLRPEFDPVRRLRQLVVSKCLCARALALHISLCIEPQHQLDIHLVYPAHSDKKFEVLEAIACQDFAWDTCLLSALNLVFEDSITVPEVSGFFSRAKYTGPKSVYHIQFGEVHRGFHHIFVSNCSDSSRGTG